MHVLTLHNRTTGARLPHLSKCMACAADMMCKCMPYPPCRYEEDVYINNHTAVWGSRWSDGAWAYACCHSTVKNSYCTGRAGEQAAAEAAQQMVRNLEAKAARAAEEQERRQKSTLSNAHLEKGQTQWGTDAIQEDANLDPERVKEALKKLEAAEKEGAEADERKRKFSSLQDGDDNNNVTAEEMEAYRLRKKHMEDPTAAFTSGTDGYDLL
eukprot:GHRR01032490.1.p1 GENE.GHRR01032490.1~~GHRR01032490.1.p1  ORF type:complete len:212 (-),score=60.58 GHRR01032490.1:79-714(-)